MLTLRVCGSPLNCLEYNHIGDMVAIGSQNGNLLAVAFFVGYFPSSYSLVAMEEA